MFIFQQAPASQKDGGGIDLKKYRKWFRKVDVDDEECLSVTAVVCARIEFTWWENASTQERNLLDEIEKIE